MGEGIQIKRHAYLDKKILLPFQYEFTSCLIRQVWETKIDFNCSKNTGTIYTNKYSIK